MRLRDVLVGLCFLAAGLSGPAHASSEEDNCYWASVSFNARLSACDAILKNSKSDRKIATALGSKALAFFYLRRYDEALAAFDVAIKMFPDDIVFRVNRAAALDAVGRHDEADADRDIILSQNAHSAEAALAQAKILFARGKSVEAENKVDAVLSKNPSIPYTVVDAHYLRGRIIVADSSASEMRIKSSIEDFNAALRIVERGDPRTSGAEILYYRALAHDRIGLVTEAIVDVNQALGLSPMDPILLGEKCWLAGEANVDLDDALMACNSALASPRIAPKKRANWLDSLGLVHFRLGRLDDALADYNGAIQIDPHLAASLYMRGVAKNQKKRDDGGSDINAALAIDPTVRDRFLKIGIRD